MTGTCQRCGKTAVVLYRTHTDFCCYSCFSQDRAITVGRKRPEPDARSVVQRIDDDEIED